MLVLVFFYPARLGEVVESEYVDELDAAFLEGAIKRFLPVPNERTNGIHLFTFRFQRFDLPFEASCAVERVVEQYDLLIGQISFDLFLQTILAT